MKRVLALVVVTAVVATSGGATASAPWVVRLGKGAGPWRIGMRLAVRPGLVAIERHPENDSAFGCTAWSRIDFYRDVRVAWVFAPNARHSVLADVATSRIGDRSAEGFVVGKTRLSTVLRRHPQRPRYPRWPGSLGVTELTVERKTGEESSAWLDYWFDAANVLAAIETGIGGC